MIIERRTNRCMHGREQAAVELTQEAFKVLGYPNMKRICRPISGPSNDMCTEFEFKDWEEREAFWAAFFALPQIPEWVDDWSTMVESGANIEFWWLVE